MANGSDWLKMLSDRGLIEDEGKLFAPVDSIVRVVLPDARNFSIRPGKSSVRGKIIGDFIELSELNIDTGGRTRITLVPLASVLSIDVVK